jgi:hypothetical protein
MVRALENAPVSECQPVSLNFNQGTFRILFGDVISSVETAVIAERDDRRATSVLYCGNGENLSLVGRSR